MGKHLRSHHARDTLHFFPPIPSLLKYEPKWQSWYFSAPKGKEQQQQLWSWIPVRECLWAVDSTFLLEPLCPSEWFHFLATFLTVSLACATKGENSHSFLAAPIPGIQIKVLCARGYHVSPSSFCSFRLLIIVLYPEFNRDNCYPLCNNLLIQGQSLYI